jgi:hypothetical protein
MATQWISIGEREYWDAKFPEYSLRVFRRSVPHHLLWAKAKPNEKEELRLMRLFEII